MKTNKYLKIAFFENISDKTISKWECGKGLPELSGIQLLCKSLEINVNELLSGEKLAEDTYSNRAEENMMTLMKDYIS